MFADDLVLMAGSEAELNVRFAEWSRTMEGNGLRVNVGKTKVMGVPRAVADMSKMGEWTCPVSWSGVVVNSLPCALCSGWVHWRCPCVKGPLCKMAGKFMSRVCLKGRFQLMRPGQLRLTVRSSSW